MSNLQKIIALGVILSVGIAWVVVKKQSAQNTVASSSVDDTSKNVDSVQSSTEKSSQGGGLPVVNGQVTSSTESSGSESVPAKGADQVVQPDCEKIAFATKQPANKADANVLSLQSFSKARELNWSSVCVRVNGVPVKAEVDKAKSTVAFGALTQKEAVVSVTVCRKGAKCAEPCVVPKDELMDSIFGDDATASASWGGQDSAGQALAKDEAKLDKELAVFHKALSGSDPQSLNSEWNVTGSEKACSKSSQVGKN